MSKRHWAITACLLATVVVLGGPASGAAIAARVFSADRGQGTAPRVQELSWETEPPSEVLNQGSEQYLLAASELGYLAAGMESESYRLNQEVTVQAEGAVAMVSEHYRLEGIVRYWHAVPLVVRNYR